MDIGSLSSLSGAAQQSIQRSNAKLQTAIATLLNGGTSSSSLVTNDTSNLSLATQLQSQVMALKQASLSLAQASSQSEVASQGVEQITDVLQQLKSLAEQAKSPTLNTADRGNLNTQFQQLASTINQIVNTTQFGGKSLLDGSLSGDNALSLERLLSAEGTDSEGSLLSIDSLTSSALFSNTALNLLSTSSAQSALSTLGSALEKVGSVAASIGAFQQTASYAAANLDSAVFNQNAAQSYLSDEDFVAGANGLSIANFQMNASLALAAQGNRLPPSFLEILL